MNRLASTGETAGARGGRASGRRLSGSAGGRNSFQVRIATGGHSLPKRNHENLGLVVGAGADGGPFDRCGIRGRAFPQPKREIRAAENSFQHCGSLRTSDNVAFKDGVATVHRETQAPTAKLHVRQNSVGAPCINLARRDRITFREGGAVYQFNFAQCVRLVLSIRA